MVMFLLLNGGAVFVALRAAIAGRAGVRPSRFMLSVLSGYLVFIHSVVLAAGLIGWLTVGALAFLTGAAVVGALWLKCPGDHGHEIADDATRVTPAALFAPLVAIAAGIAWARPHLVEATRLWIWDDYTYHMVYPALWLRQHAIAAVTPAQAFTMQAWYPLSASVVATWFMAPFHGARGESLAWVSLTAILYAGIVTSAAAELLARAGCRRGAWGVPVVLFATSDRIAVMASSFSDADLAHAAALFGALAFAVPRGGGESRRDIAVDASYAALLTGLAVGVKATAAPYAAVILLMTAMRAGAPGRRWRAAAGVAALFGVSWLATGGYWYVRNLADTGNPVYPAAFLGWTGATFPMTTLREYAQHYGVARAMSDALVVYMNWPWFHAALAVVGLVGLAGWLFTRRSALTHSQAYVAGGTLVMAAAMLLLLPATPYSAGNPMTFVAGSIHWDSMRYIGLLPILGWMSLGFLLDAGAGASYRRTFTAVVITTAALLLVPVPRLAALALVGVVVLGTMIDVRIPRRDPGRPVARRRAGVAVTMVTLVVGGIVLWMHGAKAAATATAFYREPLFGAAVAVLDRQPAGTRVAFFGDQWIYPAFGARDHLVPVRLDGDGRAAATPIGDAMAPGPVTVDPATFRTNLAASEVAVVAVVHLPHPGRSPEWPTQDAALEAVGDARLLHRDGAVAIWKLGD